MLKRPSGVPTPDSPPGPTDRERPDDVTPRGAEALFPELTRRHDGSTLLGYLNFSDGRPDPRFRKALAEVFGFLSSSGDPTPWVTAAGWLDRRARELEGTGPAAFRDLLILFLALDELVVVAERDGFGKLV